MNMNDAKHIESAATENYGKSEPWPDNDIWHFHTYNILHEYVQDKLNVLNLDNTQIVLNAGCGRTTYETQATIVYMDIIKEYINMFENYIVGSVENIPLSDNSVDCVICVGSVINYVDIQKTLLEFSRILKPNGVLILEYERSNSAEFLFTKNYAKTVFVQKYNYNDQTHYLWMYNERFVLHLAKFYNFICKGKYRYHNISSLLFRFGVSEERAAKFSKFDNVIQPLSYPISHNQILILEKTVL